MTFGKDIEIIRQRFFVEYSSLYVKKNSEEYTIICKSVNKYGIDNIFIKSPKLLPNLRIYDSDGTELALVTNRLTKALIRNLIKHSVGDVVQELNQLIDEIGKRKIFLLWIKLPALRKLFPNEARVIRLEYDAGEDEKKIKGHALEFHSAPHEVFYVIRSPDGFMFSKEEMTIYKSDGKVKKQQKAWKNEKNDPYYYNKTENYVTIRINPNTIESMSFRYSLFPKKQSLSFPIFTLGILWGASIMLFLTTQYWFTQNCAVLNFCVFIKPLEGKHVEVGMGIIAASLIIPTFINNQDVRNTASMFYILPVIVSIFAIFL